MRISTIEIVTEKIKVEGPTPSYLKIRGWAYYSLDSLDKAISDYNQAIKLDKTDHDLYFRRADVFFSMKKFTSAIADYSNAIELSPDSLNYYVSRAVAYEEKGEYDKALTDYNVVLETEPRHELALRNRAILYCGVLEQPDKGFVDWNNLLTIYPKADYYSDRGLILMKRQKFQLAANDFESALRKKPDDQKYLLRKAYCIGMAGRFTEALRDFSFLQKLNPNNSLIYKYRGEVMLKSGEKNKGCTDLFKAKEMGLDVDSLLHNCPK